MSSSPFTNTTTNTQNTDAVADNATTRVQDAYVRTPTVQDALVRTPLSHDAERVIEGTYLLDTQPFHDAVVRDRKEVDIPMSTEEHPAESDEPQQGRSLSLVTIEDWDQVHDECLKEAGYRSPSPLPALFSAATKVNRINEAPPFEKRESADPIMLARDLLSFSNQKLKRGLDKCLTIYQAYPIPLPIAVTGSLEKTRLIARIEHIYGIWPGRFIFVEDKTRILTPTITEEDNTFEESSSTRSSRLKLINAQRATLDAAYNLISYGHQLIHNLEEMNRHDVVEVKQCVEAMEHTLYGIDLAKSLADAWPRISPFHIKSYGGLYRLSPGRTKRRNESAPYRRQDSYEQQSISGVASSSRSPTTSRILSQESRRPPVVIPVRDDMTRTITQDTRSLELERCLNNLSRCDRKSPGPQQED